MITILDTPDKETYEAALEYIQGLAELSRTRMIPNGLLYDLGIFNVTIKTLWPERKIVVDGTNSGIIEDLEIITSLGGIQR